LSPHSDLLSPPGDTVNTFPLRRKFSLCATMGYDALCRRLHKTVGNRQTLFVMDSDILIAESINHQEAREYVYYPCTFESLTVIEADKQLYCYHNDKR